MKIKVNNKLTFSYQSEPLVIAEISSNHAGSKSKFLKLIKLACENGADLIKIQTYEPQDITLNKNYIIQLKVYHIYVWKCRGPN